MNSTLRFALILLVLWAGIFVLHAPFSSWFEHRLHECMLAFSSDREEQSWISHLSCSAYDIVYKWAWLLTIAASLLGALAMTIAFRRAAG
nr:putative integron gene cassette protein [uncultured bacterium]